MCILPSKGPIQDLHSSALAHTLVRGVNVVPWKGAERDVGFDDVWRTGWPQDRTGSTLGSEQSTIRKANIHNATPTAETRGSRGGWTERTG
jgi:hypothetical protein